MSLPWRKISERSVGRIRSGNSGVGLMTIVDALSVGGVDGTRIGVGARDSEKSEESRTADGGGDGKTLYVSGMLPVLPLFQLPGDVYKPIREYPESLEDIGGGVRDAEAPPPACRGGGGLPRHVTRSRGKTTLRS